jgi:hypothetical protein
MLWGYKMQGFFLQGAKNPVRSAAIEQRKPGMWETGVWLSLLTIKFGEVAGSGFGDQVLCRQGLNDHEATVLSFDGIQQVEQHKNV